MNGIEHVRPMRQHMTSSQYKYATAPYYSVTYRDLPACLVIDAHSLVVSGQWRFNPQTNFTHLCAVTIDDLSASEQVIVDHLSNLVGYMEYTVKQRMKTPYVTVDGDIVDERLAAILRKRGYTQLETGTWSRKMFRDPSA